MMEAFLVSTGVVALAEIGDKTQLLAILLAARFRAPLPILFGIFLATLFNHALAALLGTYIGAWFGENLWWILAVSFFAMGIWALLPDRMDGDSGRFDRLGAFGATLVSFFLIEIGDKTQLATIALAARFDSIAIVAAGTTLGMMIANAPAVYLGEIIAKKVPVTWMRRLAAAVFILLGLVALLDWGRGFVFA